MDKPSPQRLGRKTYTFYMGLQPWVVPRRHWDINHIPNLEVRIKIQILILLLFSWASIREALFSLGE
jgi:hypothetical protein